MGEKYFELPNPPDHLRQKCHQIIGALGIEPRFLAPHPSGLATGVLPLWGHLSKKTFYGGVKLSKTQLGGASTHLIQENVSGHPCPEIGLDAKQSQIIEAKFNNSFPSTILPFT